MSPQKLSGPAPTRCRAWLGLATRTGRATPLSGCSHQRTHVMVKGLARDQTMGGVRASRHSSLASPDSDPKHPQARGTAFTQPSIPRAR